jgi:integrase
MARRARFAIKQSDEGWRVNIPAKYSATGGRQRRFFTTRAEAEGFVRTLGVRIENYGRAAPILKPGQGEEALAAIRLLEKSSLGVGLLEAVKHHINAERRRLASKPLGEVVDAFLSAKKRSEKYCSSLKRTQRRLDPLRAVLVSEISSDDLDKIIAGASDSYRNALLREIRAIFSFAVKRGWCIANPATKLDFAQTQIGERHLYSPEESALLLETVRALDPALLPFVAIALFAGVRVYELLRMEWAHVDLAEKSIDLPAAITKRKRRRSIPIESALQAWLELFISEQGIQRGAVAPCRTYNSLRKRLRVIFSAAKIPWRQNAARHSYASYWLAVHKDLNALAMHLGHIGGLEVLHTHYHRTVKLVEAGNYWNIRPKTKARQVIQFKEAG